ncbi:Hsp70 family protein [Dactylosporangium sp. CA-092794]|uniref:Hsp70 family protein n=1 Tax=Dactylosporangium sp. CA-092794 TaxID=3239929 RepID=UPI003D8F797F
MADQYRLGIDFGTSNTVAAIHDASGRRRALLFDGFPLLPSGVCLAPDTGELLVGREAAHSARVHPECFEPHPKRRIDDGSVLLGPAELPVAHLIAAVLARVHAEAARVTGAAPAGVTLTHPAAWGNRRKEVLLDAAARAGLPAPELVPEPVAAASYFVTSTDVRVPAGASVLVYDFGAGTFDASVVRRTGDGWEVLASEGLPDAGGLDIDAAIVAYLAATYTTARPDEVRRLERPQSSADRRANRLLWDDVRTAKEVLSRATSSYIHVPLIEDDAPLGREQLERLARPVLDRTVTLTRTVIADALPSGGLAGLFLVGGSSRIPLVATLLHQSLRLAPTAIEQPELVVAEGSALPAVAPAAPAPLPPQPVSPASMSMPSVPVSAMPVSVPPEPSWPVSAPPVSAPISPIPVSPPVPRPVPRPVPPVILRPMGAPANRSPLVPALVAFGVLALLGILGQVVGGNLFEYGRWFIAEPPVLLLPAYIAWVAADLAALPAARGRRALQHGIAIAVAYFVIIELVTPLRESLPPGFRLLIVLAIAGLVTAALLVPRFLRLPPPAVLPVGALVAALVFALSIVPRYADLPPDNGEEFTGLIGTLLVMAAALVALAHSVVAAPHPAPWQSPDRLRTAAAWLLPAAALIIFVQGWVTY